MPDTSSIRLSPKQHTALTELASEIQHWGKALGFQQTGITDLQLGEHSQHFEHWLDRGLNGDMNYMQDQRALRLSPPSLQPEAIRAISVRMDYLPADTETVKLLDHPQKAYVSRYALGRDYHKLIRKRLATLANHITAFVTHHPDLQTLHCNQRPFVDSAPVLERALAEKAGLGWIGKNTMLINRSAGSWFFLGELLTNIPLPVNEPHPQKHCGSCTACLNICPTQAFDQAFVLDARKCISYLTIENRGVIPLQFRKAIGNRIFGCDDCQLICPWNKFAKPTHEPDFSPRHNLDDADLLTLFLWDEDTFLEKTKGSAIRRTGYEGWLRNIATALGNARKTNDIVAALKSRLSFSPLLDEHIHWALEQHGESA